MGEVSVYGRVGESSLVDGNSSPIRIDPTGALVVNGKTSDNTYQVLRLDPSTHAIKTVGYTHAEIHGKNTFHAYRGDTLATGDTVAIGITTPDTAKEAHIIWSMYGAGEVVMDIVRDVTSFTGGVAQVPQNSNQRGETPASICTVLVGSDGDVDDDLVLTGGTEYDSHVLGSGNKGAASGGSRDEFIPDRDSITVYRLTAVGNGIVCDLHIRWYEHTPKGL